MRVLYTKGSFGIYKGEMTCEKKGIRRGSRLAFCGLSISRCETILFFRMPPCIYDGTTSPFKIKRGCLWCSPFFSPRSETLLAGEPLVARYIMPTHSPHMFVTKRSWVNVCQFPLLTRHHWSCRLLRPVCCLLVCQLLAFGKATFFDHATIPCGDSLWIQQFPCGDMRGSYFKIWDNASGPWSKPGKLYTCKALPSHNIISHRVGITVPSNFFWPCTLRGSIFEPNPLDSHLAKS